MVHRVQRAEHARGVRTCVAREVPTHLCPDVGGLADVEHVADRVGEPVHAGLVGEPRGEPQLGRVRVSDQLRQLEQLREADDPVAAGVLEQRMEQIGGCQHVAECPVRGLVGEAERGGQGAEPAVGHRVADQPSRHREGVDGRVGERLPSGRHQRVVEEGEVEAEVVADQHRAPDELDERREHLADSRCVGDHCVVDAGELRDERRDPLVGTDEGLIGAEQLTAAEPRRGHFGQRGGRWRAAGRLDVQDHEGHLAEGSPEVVEGSRRRHSHGESVANTCSMPGVLAGGSGPGTVGWWTPRHLFGIAVPPAGT
jgi:hypothetical protein